MKLIIVDVEGGRNPDGTPVGSQFAGPGRMGEFGAVLFDEPPFTAQFYGANDSEEVMREFDAWLEQTADGDRVVFVSDNVAYDWQHMNWALWNRVGRNLFGHSGRRIGDYWAGMKGNWRDTQGWKKWRVTPHDHNPVHDALGNAEALWTMLHGKEAPDGQ